MGVSRGLLLSVLSLLAACGGGGSTAPPPGGPALTGMLLGGDISALERIEDAGGVYRDAGQARDAIAILRAHGSNAFRLRLFVNPSGEEVQVNDLAYTIRMAQRVKAAGATLVLDIHYSDTWADPSHQLTPAGWDTLDLDTLERQVEVWSAGATAQLQAAGALPDVVQIGNEVDAGMLWPLGALRYDADSLASWDRFTRLLKAGIRGVRSALGPGDDVRVLLHYSRGADAGGTRWFFDHIEQRGVPYDLIGVSYYPWWHGALSALRGNLIATAERYGRHVLVVEVAYPWRNQYLDEIVPSGAAMPWPISPQRQRQFLTDLLHVVAAVPDDRGLGVLWWYPEAVQVPGLFVWGGGSLSLFDATGNVLPAAGAFSPP
jgi:arabinogalactan endo-1,4-beta-galactosidase